jgi:undecaprenyl-diphosphatase
LSDDRLPIAHAAALGAIQGPAELLPVSSSGHLVLVPAMLGWPYRELDPEIRKSIEVALHAGGAAALLIGLRKEVAEYARSFGLHNLASLVLSFTPAALIAFRFERPIERRLSEPRPVAIALLAGSAAMAIADGRPERRGREDASLVDAIVIGAAQAFALAPGVSRNGATLAAARWRGFRRPDANVISRQIALPVIVGASVLKGARLATRELPPGIGEGMAAGAAAAFCSTLVSMRLIAMLERSRSLLPYVAYRTALGTAALIALRRRARARREVPASLNGHRATASRPGPDELPRPAVVQ